MKRSKNLPISLLATKSAARHLTPHLMAMMAMAEVAKRRRKKESE